MQTTLEKYMFALSNDRKKHLGYQHILSEVCTAEGCLQFMHKLSTE